MRFAAKTAVLVSLALVALVAPVVGSAPLHAATQQTITISAPKTIILPSSVTIRGTVTHAKKGQRVVLTQGLGRRLGSTTLDAHLAYKFTVKEKYAGTRSFRTISPAGVKSRTITVRALEWVYLSDVTPSANAGAANCASGVVIGGHTFAHSCTITAATGTPTHVEWSVHQICSKFQATLGVTDNSASDADATLSVTADTKSISSHTYARGASTQPTVDITHRATLKFDALQLHPASGAVHVALGSARVLCRDRP